MSGQLTYLAQSPANKLVAQGKGSPATPYITLMVDAPKITDITTPNACVFCWATVEPVPPEPSFGTFPQTFMHRPRDFQLDLHNLTLLEVLVDLVPHLPLAALDMLILGTPAITLPAAACIRIVFAPATHVGTLVMRGRMSERLPALLAPSSVDVDADTAAAGLLFPRLKVLSFHEADFLEEDPEDDRPRRGAWWGAFTDALRAREKADPALRLEKIVVKDAGSITKLEVGALHEFADEVVWDAWRGHDLESLADEDEDIEVADEE
ncbi:hypothetical protein PHLGIDRAFT_11330 [Phlebiopsis gigantea 11061_1 CR5-6]|uniref:Uncharacterized protein n=1 Tax=Phlebiopsis gigantea (strain 11061_1 CR5-6) TaxID=745531 RepID=A0A0C3S414_PHLG1|nr:hypothetical protein PHLGIDRAFT_11330 [Phlebiopsis gigantea 11061_1 CR5-6]